MRKRFLIVLCVLFLFVSGCDKETTLNLAHISDNTLGKSTEYSVKVVLDDDDRMDEKYVDLQVRSSEKDQIVNVGEHGKEKITLRLEKENYWYNLTFLIDRANGISSEGGYLKYGDYGNKIFNLNVPNDVNLTFRVVAGNVKKNEDSAEEILVLSEPISNEFVLEAKKKA